MNEIKFKGFILKRVQTQESDLILKIITSQGEKISAYGRAALKSKKRFEGGLTILSQIEFRAIKKHNQELWMLEESKLTYEFKNLYQSIEAFAAASFLSEITEACAQEGLENTSLYNLFGAAIKALDSGSPFWTIVPQFEVKLLMIMGWLPDFEELDLETNTILKNLLKEKISESEITLTDASRIEKLLKAYLQGHLGEGKLKSLEFLSSVRRFQEQQMVTNPKDNTNYN